MFGRPRRNCGSPADFFDIPDDGLEPCESQQACVGQIERYGGPPDAFWLAIGTSVLFSPGNADDPITHALAERGWQVDGYEIRDGYDVYRARERANRDPLSQ